MMKPTGKTGQLDRYKLDRYKLDRNKDVAIVPRNAVVVVGQGCPLSLLRSAVDFGAGSEGV
ncbi:hypothetical protein [Arthrobacter polaris]|uniref:hypothetical protein n=1 Tax=Arthrobacter polaris TaxID=2813727 RepID=UPI001F465D4E|nr:hypothetical protein [Arthrobacter polaris]UIK89706.1 hypothetical protein J0916_04775 [Arthrobacter polaris]